MKPLTVLPLVLATAWATGAAEAHAMPPQIRLGYELGGGAGDCPTRDTLRSAVDQRLGYDPFDATAEGRVEVVITARGSRYTGLVRLSGLGTGRDGERRVRAQVRGCDELVEALALAVSLALDPEAVERVKRPRRGRVLVGEPRPRWGLAPALPTVVTVAAVVTPSPVASESGWWTGARAGMSVGGAPMPSPDLRIALGYASGALGAALELRAEAPVPRSVAGGNISAHLAGATASGCYRWRWFRGCALATVGALVLHGRDLAQSRSRAEAYGSAGVRLMAAWPISD
ncbi:MAG: hypothetical protein QF464_05695, partial [Myxococcota bacterium]|nr:hypothetical protein [Myxococcota bacterium]